MLSLPIMINLHEDKQKTKIQDVRYSFNECTFVYFVLLCIFVVFSQIHFLGGKLKVNVNLYIGFTQKTTVLMEQKSDVLFFIYWMEPIEM